MLPFALPASDDLSDVELLELFGKIVFYLNNLNVDEFFNRSALTPNNMIIYSDVLKIIKESSKKFVPVLNRLNSLSVERLMDFYEGFKALWQSEKFQELQSNLRFLHSTMIDILGALPDIKGSFILCIRIV